MKLNFSKYCILKIREGMTNVAEMNELYLNGNLTEIMEK